MEVRGHRCLVGGVLVCCQGALVVCLGVSRPPAALRAAAALAFAVALWMRSAGRGQSEDGVESVDEDEDEEDVVVLGDASCAVMRAVADLWVAAASAAATAGRMEGMSSGCRLGVGGFGGPTVTRRPSAPIWSAAVGEGGERLRSSSSGLGWAGVLQCLRLCGLASAGGKSSSGLHPGAGGWAWGSSGVCRGRLRVSGRGGCAVGRGAPCGGCVWAAGCGGW